MLAAMPVWVTMSVCQRHLFVVYQLSYTLEVFRNFVAILDLHHIHSA